MLTLLLLRHAKAVRATTQEADFDRPLKESGRVSAAAMGRYLARQGLAPSRVLCSPAVRTRETWAEVSRGLPDAPPAEYADAMYAFDGCRTLLRLVAGQAGAASPLLLVGHNPCTEELALSLAAPGGALRAQMALKFPTAGLAVLRFGMGAWRDIAPGCGELLAFVRPAELTGGEDD